MTRATTTPPQPPGGAAIRSAPLLVMGRLGVAALSRAAVRSRSLVSLGQRLLAALAIAGGLGGPAFAQQVPQPVAGPPGARAWATPAVTAPGVSFHTFESAAAQATVSYHVFTPAGYDRDPTRSFPVVYWLHGSGGGLPGIPRVAAHFAAAIEAGTAPPCLVVFVNGLPNGMYVDWKDGSAPIETVIAKELVPHIDDTCRTIASREGRLLDGYSMGGYGAARLGFKYPELFRAISIMGGGPLQPDLRDAPRASRQRAADVLERVYGGDPEYFRSVSPRTLAAQHVDALRNGAIIRQVCGDRDETFAANRDFHEHLERLGIPHAWIVLPGVDHDPLATLVALGDSNWAFYRQAFGPPPAPDAAGGDRQPAADASSSSRSRHGVARPSTPPPRAARVVRRGVCESSGSSVAP